MIKIKKLPENLKLTLMNSLKIFGSYTSINYDLSNAKKKEMMSNIKIKTAVNNLKLSIQARKLKLNSALEEDKNKEEIYNRLVKDVENFEDFESNILDTEYYGASIFAIVYNDDWTIKRYELIPRDRYFFDYNTKKVFFTSYGQNIYPEDYPELFLICSYKKSLEFPLGEGELISLYPTYEAIKGLDTKMQGIAEKYGEVITVFAYDPSFYDLENDEDSAKLNAYIDSIKETKGGDILAIPVWNNTDGNKLSDQFFYITMSDLKTDSHITLVEKFEKDINQFILNSNLISMGQNGGSYALGNVLQSQTEKKENATVERLIKEYDTLLFIDSTIWGYNWKDYSFSLGLLNDQMQEEKIEKERADTRKANVEALEKLSNLGKSITNEEMSELLGLEIIDSEKKVDNPAQEFAKKKDVISKKKEIRDNQDKILEENISSYLQIFSEKMCEELKKNKIKSQEDIKNISLNMQDLREKMQLTYMLGISDERYINNPKNLEFEEELQAIFNLPFNEAVEYMINLTPALYSQLESIEAKIDEYYFYVKRSTELETTIKLQKSLQKVLKEGLTFDSWIKEIDTYIVNVGLGSGGWYWNTVFRTNIQSAYNAGHMQEQFNNEDIKYLLYDGILDGREQEHTRIYDGKVYRKDNPIWGRIYPPNGFNCRCRVISLTKEDMQEFGFKANTPTKAEKELELDISKSPMDLNSVKKSVKDKEENI